jgi:hypothetical protein
MPHHRVALDKRKLAAEIPKRALDLTASNRFSGQRQLRRGASHTPVLQGSIFNGRLTQFPQFHKEAV